MFKIIQCSCRIVVIGLSLVWLFQVPAEAGIYKWRDDKGSLHYTDSKAKIPMKYRNQVEKFKGVVEPKPKPVEEPVKEEENEEQTAENEPPASEEKKVDPALLSALQKTVKFFEVENRAHKRLTDFVEPIARNGVSYRNAIRKSSSKKALYEELEPFELPSLKLARSFIKNSLATDTTSLERIQGKQGDSGYPALLAGIKRRLVSDIATKENIIGKLQEDFKKLEAESKKPKSDSKKPPPDSDSNKQ